MTFFFGELFLYLSIPREYDEQDLGQFSSNQIQITSSIFSPTKLAFILTEHLITFHNICFLLYVNELMTDWIDTIG